MKSAPPIPIIYEKALKSICPKRAVERRESKSGSFRILKPENKSPDEYPAPLSLIKIIEGKTKTIASSKIDAKRVVTSRSSFLRGKRPDKRSNTSTVKKSMPHIAPLLSFFNYFHSSFGYYIVNGNVKFSDGKRIHHKLRKNKSGCRTVIISYKSIIISAAVANSVALFIV